MKHSYILKAGTIQGVLPYLEWHTYLSLARGLFHKNDGGLISGLLASNAVNKRFKDF